MEGSPGAVGKGFLPMDYDFFQKGRCEPLPCLFIHVLFPFGSAMD